MALRIRKDGRVLCAAYHQAEPGDLYLDDYVHSYLAQCNPIRKADVNQLSNYDWETHEYYVGGRDYKKDEADCSCYHPEYGVPRCWGTKNSEECRCNGDIKNCDFYQYDNDGKCIGLK